MSVNKLDTKKDIAKRFRDFYKHKGLTQIELAELIGTHQNNISAAVGPNAKRGVPEVWIYRLKEIYPMINVDWFLLGEGEMYLSEDTVLEEPRVAYEKAATRLTPDEMTTAIARLQLRVMELESRVLELEGRVKGG